MSLTVLSWQTFCNILYFWLLEYLFLESLAATLISLISVGGNLMWAALILYRGWKECASMSPKSSLRLLTNTLHNHIDFPRKTIHVADTNFKLEIGCGLKMNLGSRELLWPTLSVLIYPSRLSQFAATD
jgi:hypothetical protein